MALNFKWSEDMCEKFYMERSDEPEWEEMFTQVASESRAYLGQ
jgi:hypothetical protein